MKLYFLSVTKRIDANTIWMCILERRVWNWTLKTGLPEVTCTRCPCTLRFRSHGGPCGANDTTGRAVAVVRVRRVRIEVNRLTEWRTGDLETF